MSAYSSRSSCLIFHLSSSLDSIVPLITPACDAAVVVMSKGRPLPQPFVPLYWPY